MTLTVEKPRIADTTRRLENACQHVQESWNHEQRIDRSRMAKKMQIKLAEQLGLVH